MFSRTVFRAVERSSLFSRTAISPPKSSVSFLIMLLASVVVYGISGGERWSSMGNFCPLLYKILRDEKYRFAPSLLTNSI